jgi:2-polyprenyl-6-methoxyphenol hydroxylase-like FAD-dependent oxidoreductase
MATDGPRVLVIGGGAGGAAVALALHKAEITTSVYEAHPHSTEHYGAYLSVQSNGMDALRAIDADQVVASAAFPSRAVEVFSGVDGRHLGGVRYDGDSGGSVLTRAELARVLQTEAVRRGIAVEHGRRLVGIEATADGVSIRFADGGTAEGDLVVGADGVWSQVRTFIDPAAPSPCYLGHVVAFGHASTVPEPTPPDAGYFYRGRHAAYGYRSFRDGTTRWYASLTMPELPPAVIHGMSSTDWRRHVLKFVAEDPTPFVGVVEATDQGILGVNAYELPSLPSWYTRTAVLLGDALHASSSRFGQGSSMAFEDAVVLARCLRDTTNPTDAFRSYERARRFRVEDVANLSAGRPPTHHPLDDHSWLADHHLDWDKPMTR